MVECTAQSAALASFPSTDGQGVLATLVHSIGLQVQLIEVHLDVAGIGRRYDPKDTVGGAELSLGVVRALPQQIDGNAGGVAAGHGATAGAPGDGTVVASLTDS